jgi:hypothetical protein
MRVYFYCRSEPGVLQEDVVTLAEGLLELGVPFSGNCNYWLQSTEPGDYLIKHVPAIQPDDCDVVVVSYLWPLWMTMGEFKTFRSPLPEGLFKRGRRYVAVYMDNHDGHRTVSWEPEFRQFDVILRSKLNKRAWHPNNMKPWVHGFTNRILKAVESQLPFEQRRRVALVNFGASHPYGHGARTEAARSFLPELEKLIPFDTTKDDLQTVPADPYERLMWEQTGMRFSQSYYDRLKTSQVVACFCGELIPPMPWMNPDQYLVGGNKAKLKRVFYEMLAKLDLRPPRSVQWDSFRAWEAWVAGCANINIDLDLYGPILPVMPKNWEHYIGVDLGRPMETIDRLKNEPGLLERIAREGRAWALENYSPRAMAGRMLSHAGVLSAAAGAKLCVKS